MARKHKVTLNEEGEAVVERPAYFASINTDPRYMLTAIGAPMPNLHVIEEINDAVLTAGAGAEPGDPMPVCSFHIAGGKPGAKVSWEVKAVRNDRWVRRCGAPIDHEKPARERGKYQHPELYGQPPEMDMNYAAEHGPGFNGHPSSPTVVDPETRRLPADGSD